MEMLFKIAWRNVWRNPRRSWVLMVAIAVGVFSSLGAIGFMNGFSVEMVDSAIELQGGHVQVSAAGYFENPTIHTYIDEAEAVEQAVERLPGVAWAPAVSFPGMANSAEQAAGVRINGVDPARERQVTSIGQAVVAGEYLSETDGENEILIGQALAERLNVRLGEKVVLMANDLENAVSGGAYRVVGLFKTSSTDFDKSQVYLHIDAARALAGYGAGQLSTVSLRLPPDAVLGDVVAALRASLEGTGLEVLSWRDRSPMVVLALDAYEYMRIVLVVVLFAAVAFTIINSFLMVIFERIREIGIMMAGGVRPRQIRLMLYLEAVFMVLLGTALGGIAAGLMIGYWQRNGLDLSGFAEGLGSMGIGTVVHPYLEGAQFVMTLVVILVMVLLAVLYPAFKASRFDAVEAINYV
jgi:putative ABC transport system permease protein